ncbi:MAG: glutamine amidotransferase [Gammaproteobacteria bacterium]|nr:glutamine amidotransferase [Gammaproteobacteria bacterium]
MTRKALVIRHMKKMRGDRVSTWLSANGFELDYRCPAEGEALPDSDEGHALTLVYGGVQSANDDGFIDDEIEWIRHWVGDGRPYLGLCLGGQLLARAFGAEVARHDRGLHEVGFVEIRPAADRTFLPAPLKVYQWHKEGFALPEKAELLAVGDSFPNQAFRYGEAAYGLQFHPEVTVDIMREWMADGAESLAAPGASSREQQLADASRYGNAMAAWLENFLGGVLLPLVERGEPEPVKNIAPRRM